MFETQVLYFDLRSILCTKIYVLSVCVEVGKKTMVIRKHATISSNIDRKSALSLIVSETIILHFLNQKNPTISMPKILHPYHYRIPVRKYEGAPCKHFLCVDNYSLQLDLVKFWFF